MTATASTTAATRTRDVLPAALAREVESLLSAKARPSAERPTSIKDAVVRWLNEEL